MWKLEQPDHCNLDNLPHAPQSNYENPALYGKKRQNFYVTGVLTVERIWNILVNRL